MNQPPFVRDLRTTVRIVYTEEWQLLLGAGAGMLAFPVWVAATGIVAAAVASVTGLSLVPAVWSDRTTAIAFVLGAVWLVAPAVLGSYLLRDRRILNENGALRTCYRLRHPLTLLVPPLVAMLIGVALLPAASLLGEALVVIGACHLAYRTAVYGHRVFALSVPRFATGILALTLAGLALAALTAGAIALGRDALVAEASAGIAGTLGVPALGSYGDGTVLVAGRRLSSVAATVAAPALVVGLGYVLLQMAVSGVQRIRQPNVKRSSLRTGQLYPGYATPATGVGGRPGSGDGPTPRRPTAAGNGGGSATTSDANRTNPTGPDSRHTRAAQAETEPAGGGQVQDDDTDDVADISAGNGQTRVYSPPSNVAGHDHDPAPDPDADADTDTGEETGGSQPSPGGTYCPTCEREYDEDDRIFCPTCGTRLVGG